MASTPEGITEFLDDTLLFGGLEAEVRERLASIALPRSFSRGELIFSEGDPAEGFHLVRKGRVKVFQLSAEGKEQILHVLWPGEPFGEVAVFAGMNYPAYSEAMERTETLFFRRDAFLNLIGSDPIIASNMLAVLSLRLRQFARMIENLSLKEVPARLAAYLLSVKPEDRSKVHLSISKSQLANLLGTVPETLSRVLSRFQSQGMIRVKGREIEILDQEALEEICG